MITLFRWILSRKRLKNPLIEIVRIILIPRLVCIKERKSKNDEAYNTRDRTPEELQEIEDRYSTAINEKGKEVITYMPLASNELERLSNLKESTINEMRNDIDFYKETALYLEIKVLLSSLDKRIKELS